MPRSIISPDLRISLGLPNSKNIKAVNNEIQPIIKYIIPIKIIKNIVLNN